MVSKIFYAKKKCYHNFFRKKSWIFFLFHNMKQNETNLDPKSTEIFLCDKCDYNTSKQKLYDRHLLTLKHKMKQNETNLKQKSTDLEILSCKYCDKTFKSRTTLWRHNKKCSMNKEPELCDFKDANSLIIQLLKQNQELQKSLVELSKEKTITNNNNNNSHNKTFNLQFFLNEQCKDALNIQEFVSSIKLTLKDLENTGKLGYVEGVSNIILKNMKCLDTHKRPIHCGDLKREVIYIKDNNEWTKETEEKPILTNAIKVIANENIKQIHEYIKENPDCTNPDSKKNNLYLKIVSNAMSGSTKEETDKNINKIINNVAKEVLIERKMSELA